MKRAILFALILGVVNAGAQSRNTSQVLSIYLVDVEGGNATLFVSPSGESVLIDTGNVAPGAARDAERIMAAAKDAGISQINTLITTHWHNDHFGGMAELANRLPIRHFVDHGPNVQPAAAPDEFLQKVYPTLYGKSTHTVVKPGDRIPIAGLEWRIVSAGGQTIKTRLPGAQQANPFCGGFKPHTVNPVSGLPVGNTEDEQSVGSHVTFGRFRAVHLGDLTWNKEFELMCPENRLGTADLFVASRHGQPSSNSELLVHAIRPRVAIVNNAARKGGQGDAMRVLYTSPGLEGIWQAHYSLLGGREYAVPGIFIANESEETPHDGEAHWIKVLARADGTFTVTNSRNGFSRSY
ncbi:MAG: MBL fold metallo-hydrolase [Vicinamibacterales bacterium]|nr:MBL fold metallo-hydrolase [Vicinamibacterales bacterium]